MGDAACPFGVEVVGAVQQEVGKAGLAQALLAVREARFDVLLIATGSEVELAMEAMRRLAGDGIKARVVSMPCAEVFDRQPLEWREAVLPSWCRKRVAVEAGVTGFWHKYVGLDGKVVGIDSFGASAPADQLYAHFGITADAVVAAAKAL